LVLSSSASDCVEFSGTSISSDVLSRRGDAFALTCIGAGIILAAVLDPFDCCVVVDCTLVALAIRFALEVPAFTALVPAFTALVPVFTALVPVFTALVPVFTALVPVLTVTVVFVPPSGVTSTVYLVIFLLYYLIFYQADDTRRVTKRTDTGIGSSSI